MSYLVVDVDGALHHRETPATIEAVRREVGDWDMVRLGNQPIRGWVNDTGLIDGTARNVIGSILLHVCEASQQPYAGPIVITGWHRYRELVDMSERQVALVSSMHGCLAEIVNGTGPCGGWCDDRLRGLVLQDAEMVRTVPTPGLRFIGLDELGRQT